jgi:hypothetical protein
MQSGLDSDPGSDRRRAWVICKKIFDIFSGKLLFSGVSMPWKQGYATD